MAPTEVQQSDAPASAEASEAESTASATAESTERADLAEEDEQAAPDAVPNEGIRDAGSSNLLQDLGSSATWKPSSLGSSIHVQPNINPTTGIGTCTPTFMADSQSKLNVNADGSMSDGNASDVSRRATVSPWGTGLYLQAQQTDPNFRIVNAEGRTLGLNDRGYTQFQLDGWVPNGTAANVTQNSRIRVAAAYAMENVDILWRVDPRGTLQSTAPTLGNWGVNPLSGYTVPAGLNTRMETINGHRYVRITGNMPAKSYFSATVSATHTNPNPGQSLPAAQELYAWAGMKGTLAASSGISCAATDRVNNTPGYQPATVVSGETVEQPQSGDTTMPAGTKYAQGPANPEDPIPADWTIVVDETTGAITVTAPADLTEATTITIPVVVTYPDGTTETINAVFTATPNDAGANTPGYDSGTAIPGQPVTVEQTGDTEMPAGTQYELNPGYTVPEGLTITVDPNTGAITVTAPSGVTEATTITIPVLVTYPDGSTEVINAEFTVTPAGQPTPTPEPTDPTPSPEPTDPAPTTPAPAPTQPGDPSDPQRPRDLADTGAQTAGLIGFGLLALALGAGLIAARRRSQGQS